MREITMLERIEDCETADDVSEFMDGRLASRRREIEAGRKPTTVDALYLAIAMVAREMSGRNRKRNRK